MFGVLVCLNLLFANTFCQTQTDAEIPQESFTFTNVGEGVLGMNLGHIVMEVNIPDIYAMVQKAFSQYKEYCSNPLSSYYGAEAISKVKLHCTDLLPKAKHLARKLTEFLFVAGALKDTDGKLMQQMETLLQDSRNLNITLPGQLKFREARTKRGAIGILTTIASFGLGFLRNREISSIFNLVGKNFANINDNVKGLIAKVNSHETRMKHSDIYLKEFSFHMAQLREKVQRHSYFLNLQWHRVEIEANFQHILDNTDRFISGLISLGDNKFPTSLVDFPELKATFYKVIKQAHDIGFSPVSQDWRSLYHSPTSVRKSDATGQIFVIISIPLLHQNYPTFQFWKFQPIPWVHNDLMLQISSTPKILAMSNRGDISLELDPLDLQSCWEWNQRKYCRHSILVERDHHHSCLASLFKGNLKNVKKICNIKISLKRPYIRKMGEVKYMSYTLEPENLNLVCPTESKTIQLVDHTYFEAEAGCTGFSTSFFFQSNLVLDFEENINTIPVAKPEELNIFELTQSKPDFIEDILTSLAEHEDPQISSRDLQTLKILHEPLAQQELQENLSLSKWYMFDILVVVVILTLGVFSLVVSLNIRKIWTWWRRRRQLEIRQEEVGLQPLDRVRDQLGEGYID